MTSAITTIIPTYRRPALLRRAIASVLAQTHTDLTVCVYDNASGDETAAVVADIARVDPRVVYHCHAENIGTFANFSYGLQAVSSRYFSFLSDDDVLLPEFYSNAVAALDADPDAAFWAGTAIVMRDDGTVKDATDWPEQRYEAPEGLVAMVDNNHLIWTSVLFRTDLVKRIGGLDPDVGAPIDTDYMLRIAARYPYLTAQAPSAIWMSHPESSTVLADPGFVWPCWLKAIRNITDNAELPAPVRLQVGRGLTAQLQRQLFQIGANSIRQNKFDDARIVAHILRETYGLKGRAVLLAGLAAMLSRIPALRPLLPWADRARSRLRPHAQKRTARMQARYRDYARFIAMPPANWPQA